MLGLKLNYVSKRGHMWYSLQTFHLVAELSSLERCASAASGRLQILIYISTE